MSDRMRTKVSNQEAIKQFVKSDGFRVLSIIKSGEHFRYVEDTLLYEATTPSVPSHSYWEETYRSGIYVDALAAETAALESTSWLKAENPN
jgi:hypothetical protein